MLCDTKLVRKSLKNIINQQKFFRHITYHQIRLLLREFAFPFVIYFLILFLYMIFAIASLITTKDHLNLLNYDRRHIK